MSDIPCVRVRHDDTPCENPASERNVTASLGIYELELQMFSFTVWRTHTIYHLAHCLYDYNYVYTLTLQPPICK